MAQHVQFYNGNLILTLSCNSRYNKNDSDFPSLREYNDYLELIEEIGKLFMYLFVYLLLICHMPSIAIYTVLH